MLIDSDWFYSYYVLQIEGGTFVWKVKAKDA